ncbi:MAG: ATP-binding protein, partial [Deltaproteobacteria bacterium]|nr:ATP-binding protein [Deltaproteobacteria bacterium]
MSFAKQRKSLFEIFLRSWFPYVDKSWFFPKLYESFIFEPIFLARPRRFGKSLLVASLDDFFTGRTELFQGFQAEEFMNSRNFMPRPVIRLDMSEANALSDGVDSLKRGMIDILDINARRHGVELSKQDPEARFKELIDLVASKSPDDSCVLLIDEYDSPVVSLTAIDGELWDKKLIDAVRKVMRPFYRTIKSSGIYLRFTLLTGVTKFAIMGVFSELNNLKDISMAPKYAALCGFTQAELEKNYAPFIEKFARQNEAEVSALLKTLRDEYYGFSFDGKTRVYNPFSIFNFMSEGEVDNYWMDSGSDIFLRYFLQDKAAFLGNYSGLKISDDFAKHPGLIEKTPPEGFLYQAGYLTLRKDDDGKLSLDYPNGEVRKSMTKLSLLAMMDDSVTEAGQFYDELSSCLRSGDPVIVFQHIRRVIADFSYQSLFAAADKLQDYAETESDGRLTRSPGEVVYQKFLLKYFTEMNVLAIKEKSGSLGRADLVVRFLEHTYVIELKMAKDGDAMDAAKKGMAQIREKNYGAAYKNPVLLSLGLDKNRREARACVFSSSNLQGWLVADSEGNINSMGRAENQDP